MLATETTHPRPSGPRAQYRLDCILWRVRSVCVVSPCPSPGHFKLWLPHYPSSPLLFLALFPFLVLSLLFFITHQSPPTQSVSEEKIEPE